MTSSQAKSIDGNFLMPRLKIKVDCQLWQWVSVLGVTLPHTIDSILPQVTLFLFTGTLFVMVIYSSESIKSSSPRIGAILCSKSEGLQK